MAWSSNLSKNLKELRILLSPSAPASSSTRLFIEKNYKDLKKLNPKLPIMIREAANAEPQLWARYDLGFERGIRLNGTTEDQISKALEDLANYNEAMHFSNVEYADMPAILWIEVKDLTTNIIRGDKKIFLLAQRQIKTASCGYCKHAD